jgi:hypothetical protein
VWPLAVVVSDLFGELVPCIVEAEERCLVQELVAHAAVEALDESVLDRLAWGNEVPVDGVVLAPVNIALQVNSVPLSETGQ